MATFRFELVSPEKMAFAGAAEAVIIPAENGEMMVMAGHAPFMTTLKTGVVTIIEDDKKKTKVLITGGYLDINPAMVSVLAEHAIPEDMWSGELLDAEIEKLTKTAESLEDFDEKMPVEDSLNFVKQLRAGL